MGAYLERWVNDAPNFARETTDFFIDRPLTNITQVVAGCRERLKLIAPVKNEAAYSWALENFIIAFYETHERFQNAQAAFKKGDLAAARAAMTGCRPVPVIEQFAKFSSLGGITRGEQGLVVSMNTRWLPHIVRLRQQIGMEPVRYNFGPTSHDPLAQLPGRFTFHFDAERRLWQTLGTEETGAKTFAAPRASHEICRSGIESDKALTLVLRPILSAKKNPATIPAGDYQLRLLMHDPASKMADQRVFSVSVNGKVVEERVDIFAASGGRQRALERVWPVKLDRPGVVTVTLTPAKGKALVCGAALEPVR